MHSDEKSIRAILRESKHKIPNYQRRYSWSGSNINDFWTDLLKYPTGHFLGSFVVSGSKDGEKEVVDGQQRLTTAIIALAALRDQFELNENPELANGLHENFIFFKNESVHWDKRLVNEDLTVQERLVDNIFTRPSERKLPTDVSENSVPELEAYRIFSQLISNSITQASTPAERVTILESIKEKILGAQVVYILVDTRKDAFRTFETLNDRGKSLETSDLVKNYLFQYLDSENGDQCIKSWSEMASIVEQCKYIKISADEFLYYAWNSREKDGGNSTKYIQKERILRSISDHVEQATPEEERERSRKIIDYFYFCALLLQAFDDTIGEKGSASPWKKLDRNFRVDKWDAISRDLYGVLVTTAQQPLTLLFALFSSYFAEKITKKWLEKFLKEVHHFQFRWSISKKPSTEAQRKPYRVAALALTNATNIRQIESSFSDFCKNVSQIKPTDKQFRDGLASLATSHSQRGDYYKILFILQEIDRNSSQPPTQITAPSIEHIEGIARKSEKTKRNSWIFKMGNLMVLPASLNSGLPEPFAEKKGTITSLHQY